MELTIDQVRERATNYLNAKIFFCKKEIEQRELELDGVIPTYVDIELVEKQLRAEKRKLAMLEYLFENTIKEIESSLKKCKNKCKKTCTGN